MLKIKKWKNRIHLDSTDESGDASPSAKKRGRPRGRAKCKPQRRYLVPKIKYTHGVTIIEDTTNTQE